MSYQRAATKIRSVTDQDNSKKYRESDELEVYSGNYLHFCTSLQQISLSFGHRITALDLGCGTGRYFNCLQNVDGLTALERLARNVKAGSLSYKRGGH